MKNLLIFLFVFIVFIGFTNGTEGYYVTGANRVTIGYYYIQIWHGFFFPGCRIPKSTVIYYKINNGKKIYLQEKVEEN